MMVSKFLQFCICIIIALLIVFHKVFINVRITNDRFFYRYCDKKKIPLRKAIENRKELNDIVYELSKSLGFTPQIKICNFFSKEKNATAVSKKTILLYAAYLPDFLSGEHMDYFRLLMGHELAHLKNEDPIVFPIIKNQKIKKILMEVRADIDGRIIAGLSKEDAARIREEATKDRISYDQPGLGYPSGKDRVRYLATFDTFEDAKETVIKEYKNKRR